MLTEIAPKTGQSREELERKMQKLRQQSLIAARKGDYRKLAELTAQASRLKSSRSLEQVSEPIS